MNDYEKRIKILEEELFNIGPVLAKKLVDAGISTPEELEKIGAKKAYLKIHESGGFCGTVNAAYLYALEGAILGCDWLDIPDATKREYKAFTEDLRTMYTGSEN